MPSDSLRSFYRRLIDGDAPIHSDLQHRVVEHLLADREFALLGQLARRSDLTPEVDAVLAARGEALVIAGWASRPGRTREELIARLGEEKRATVLLPLAKMTDLPEEVYRQVAESSSVKVSEALLGNTSVPRDVKRSKIADALPVLERKSSWKQREFFASAIGDDQEMLTLVASRASSASVVRYCLENLRVMSPELIDSVFERIDSLVADKGYYSDEGPGLCLALAEQDLKAEHLQKLRDIAKEKTKGSGSRHGSFDDVKFFVSEKGRGTLRKIHRLSRSTDLKESMTLLNGLKKDGGSHYVEQRLHAAIAANPVLPPDVVTPFAEHMWGDTVSVLALNWAARGELAKVAELACESHWKPDWLDAVPDVGGLLKAVVEYTRLRDESVPTWVLTHESVLASPEASVALLPWNHLYRVDTEGLSSYMFNSEEASTAETRRKTDAVIAVAQQMIVDRLGSDKMLWETFKTLADEFEGTLPDLLDAVEAISA